MSPNRGFFHRSARRYGDGIAGIHCLYIVWKVAEFQVKQIEMIRRMQLWILREMPATRDFRACGDNAGL